MSPLALRFGDPAIWKATWGRLIYCDPHVSFFGLWIRQLRALVTLGAPTGSSIQLGRSRAKHCSWWTLLVTRKINTMIKSGGSLILVEQSKTIYPYCFLQWCDGIPQNRVRTPPAVIVEPNPFSVTEMFNFFFRDYRDVYDQIPFNIWCSISTSWSRSNMLSSKCGIHYSHANRVKPKDKIFYS